MLPLSIRPHLSTKQVARPRFPNAENNCFTKQVAFDPYRMHSMSYRQIPPGKIAQRDRTVASFELSSEPICYAAPAVCAHLCDLGQQLHFDEAGCGGIVPD